MGIRGVTSRVEFGGEALYAAKAGADFIGVRRVETRATVGTGFFE
jgi:hypothetical protein